MQLRRLNCTSELHFVYSIAGSWLSWYAIEAQLRRLNCTSELHFVYSLNCISRCNWGASTASQDNQDPNRPTQSIMYVPLQVNRSQKCILLTVQYKYIKSCSGDFYSPESDPLHKIMRYWVYYSTQLCCGFPPDRICQAEMICVGGVPVLKRHFGGAGP